MIALIRSEIRKIFKNKLYFILLLAVLFVPTCMTLKESFSESNVINGKYIAGYDYMKQRIESGKMLSGEVNQEWLEKVDDLNAIEYGNFVVNQEWEDYDARKRYYKGQDEFDNPIYEYEEMTKEIEQENEFVKQQFRNIKHFYYGESTIIFSIMKCLSNTGAFLAFYILILFSTIFNKEEKDDRISLLKATKQGKRKLAIAKILTTILLSIAIPTLIIVFVFLIHVLLFGFPDMKVSFQVLTQTRFDKISPFTFGEALFFVSGLYIVGSFVIGISSMLLSRIISSSYHTLIIGFVILILPMFFNLKIGTFLIKNIFPLTFMNSGYEMLTNVSTIGNYSFYDVIFILKTSLLSILLILLTYFIDRKELHI